MTVFAESRAFLDSVGTIWAIFEVFHKGKEAEKDYRRNNNDHVSIVNIIFSHSLVMR